MRYMGIIDGGYYFLYYDELYPKGVLARRIPETPTTPPVILGFPPGKSTQGKGIKIVSPKTNGTKITSAICSITSW